MCLQDAGDRRFRKALYGPVRWNHHPLIPNNQRYSDGKRVICRQIVFQCLVRLNTDALGVTVTGGDGCRQEKSQRIIAPLEKLGIGDGDFDGIFGLKVADVHGVKTKTQQFIQMLMS